MTLIGIETITSWDIQVIRYFAILTDESIADRYRDYQREILICYPPIIFRAIDMSQLYRDT